jgi:hypothetical protein
VERFTLCVGGGRCHDGCAWIVQCPEIVGLRPVDTWKKVLEIQNKLKTLKNSGDERLTELYEQTNQRFIEVLSDIYF